MPRMTSLKPLLERSGPFMQPEFVGDPGNLEYLGTEVSILLVGAGGLGCELIKNLALSGFKCITLIDMDTIDVSNLNRQFLFRSGDEGKYKAQVAADRLMEVVPDCQITPHTCKIQDFDVKWYSQFNIVIAGLDNQEARRWLNETLCDLVTYTADGEVDPESIIPLVDGGTEGFMGQARMFFPRKTSCFQCQLASDAGGPDLHICTVAVTPRVPEHCAMYAQMFLWDRLIEFKSAKDYKMADEGEAVESKIKLDKDNGHHMTWLFNRAQEWADKHGIKGLTYSLTQQVVKNIIPAVAATNATVAAACVNECLKFITYTAPNVNTYFQYNGRSTSQGTYARTFVYERNVDCVACHEPFVLSFPADATGGHLLDELKTRGFEHVIMLTRPGGTLLAGKNSMANFRGVTLAEKLDAEYRWVVVEDDYKGFKKVWVNFV